MNKHLNYTYHRGCRKNINVMFEKKIHLVSVACVITIATIYAQPLHGLKKPPLPDSTGKKLTTTKSRLSFGEPVFDFGRVPRNTVLKHAFKYGVSVVDTVHIVRSASSCGCTFAEVPKKPLAPQDTGSIIVTYKTSNVESPFEKTFTLYTNSELTPEIVLTLKGTVFRCVSPNPPVIHLDEAQIGSGWKKNITVSWERWANTKLKKPKKAPSFISIGTPIQDKNDKVTWRISVSLSPKAQAKYYLDTLVIPTTDTTWPEVKIPVQGTIKDIVTTKPLVVNMGQVKIGTQTSNSFLVVSSVQGSRVEKVQSSTDKIHAKVGKVENNGKITRINLSTSSTPEPGTIGTNILVTVNVSGKNRELKVPVVGRFVD